MGWSFDYLKGISKANESEICPKSKKGKSHKGELWFGAFYCKRCNVQIDKLKD